MYLFGSYARGDNKPDSDIDIMVESDKELRAIPKSWLIPMGGPVDAFHCDSDPLYSVWAAVRQEDLQITPLAILPYREAEHEARKITLAELGGMVGASKWQGKKELEMICEVYQRGELVGKDKYDIFLDIDILRKDYGGLTLEEYVQKLKEDGR